MSGWIFVMRLCGRRTPPARALPTCAGRCPDVLAWRAKPKRHWRLISGDGGSDGSPLRHRVKTMEANGESGATRTGWNEKIARGGQSQDEAVQPGP